ncbi:hypothetical protein M8C21_020366 [Ambrosia artemisiifolia]|uniref:J domain-containing protein n=1 Tax=Ambrosia artemisiifolia TaxID=4212 RepID=A0AAD5G5H2_AMBAR|nr:hypothetical protein M8C21_020366 [Ambrosia artemisiifolia]
MLRNVHAFAENLFQGCYERHEFEPSSSHSNSWFRNLNGGPRGFNGTKANSKGAKARARKKGFQFYEDDEEVETIFRSAFGSNAGFYFWSFVNDGSPRSSSGYYNSNRASWNWRQQFEDDDDEDDEDDDESESVKPELRKDRIALGLSCSGPLSLEDVKNAYRACALKWHPDRHNGSSKVTFKYGLSWVGLDWLAVAEEKFKVCSAAYQSLCDKLAPN